MSMLYKKNFKEECLSVFKADVHKTFFDDLMACFAHDLLMNFKQIRGLSCTVSQSDQLLFGLI